MHEVRVVEYLFEGYQGSFIQYTVDGDYSDNCVLYIQQIATRNNMARAMSTHIPSVHYGTWHELKAEVERLIQNRCQGGYCKEILNG